MFKDVVADPPSHVVESPSPLPGEAGPGRGLIGAQRSGYSEAFASLARSDNRLDDIYGVGLAEGQRLPLLLAPTTAGTGSEVTPIAIVTTPTTEKKGVVSPRLLPDLAMLDPELTWGLPPHVTAATGIDAMVHAIEAYTCRHKKNPLSDQLARQALALLSANIREACRRLRPGGARDMLLGSMLAGMAFANAPVAAVHALAYPIGATSMCRRALNALVLMGVLRFNLAEAQALYAELAPILDPQRRACRLLSGREPSWTRLQPSAGLQGSGLLAEVGACSAAPAAPPPQPRFGAISTAGSRPTGSRTAVSCGFPDGPGVPRRPAEARVQR